MPISTCMHLNIFKDEIGQSECGSRSIEVVNGTCCQFSDLFIQPIDDGDFAFTLLLQARDLFVNPLGISHQGHVAYVGPSHFSYPGDVTVACPGTTGP